MEEFHQQLLSVLPVHPQSGISIGEVRKRLSLAHSATGNPRTLEARLRRNLEKMDRGYPNLLVVDSSGKPTLYSRYPDKHHDNLLALQQLALHQDKVTRLLPPEQQQTLQQLALPHGGTFAARWQQKIYLAPSSVWLAPPIDGAIAQVVYQAVERELPFRFDYTNSKGEQSRKTLMPWGLMFKSDKVYVIGTETHKRLEQPVAYALHRMANPEPVPFDAEAARRPAHRSLTDICQQYDIGLFSNSKDQMIALELKFYGDAARHIDDTPLSVDQQVIELSPQCRLLKATVRDCYELRKFIRGFGRNAEVLAPAELRQAMAEEFAQLAGRYGVVTAPAIEMTTDNAN